MGCFGRFVSLFRPEDADQNIRLPQGILDATAQATGIRGRHLSAQNAGKFLEHRVALIDQHRRFRADVTETQDSRSVADHGDGIPLDRQLPDFGVLFRNGGTNALHAGCAGHRERVPHRQRRFVLLSVLFGFSRL